MHLFKYICIYSTCWLPVAINVPKCNTVYSVLQYSSVINISTRHGGVWCLVPINAILHGINCHALRTKETLKPHVRRRCGAGQSRRFKRLEQGLAESSGAAPSLKNASHGDFFGWKPLGHHICNFCFPGFLAGRRPKFRCDFWEVVWEHPSTLAPLETAFH